MDEHTDTNAEAWPRDEGRGVLLMRAGGHAFAVYAEECEGVTPWAEPAPLPHAPAAVLGVASVRGRMRTVLDLARLFEASGPPHEGHPARHLLIVSLEGDEQLALACETSAHATLRADEKLSPPASPLLPSSAAFFRDGETVHILDPARLFDAAMSGTERRRQRAVNREP
jgi:chemotaxis signal transduction protein